MCAAGQCWPPFFIAEKHPMEGESHHFVRSTDFDILYYNCRSLLPKIDLLRAVCETTHPDVVCVVETWLNSDILNSELYVPNYSVLRLDRNRHGGGVALFIQNNISYVPILTDIPNLEFLLVSLTRHQLHLNIGVFYRPPSSSHIIFDTLTDALLSSHQSILSNLIILGDFNVNFVPTHHLYSHLFNFICNFSLSQLVKSPTHFSPTGLPSTIDLALTSNLAMIKSCTTVPELQNSDHLGIRILVKQGHYERNNLLRRRIWCYSSANYTRAAELMDTIDWDEELIVENINVSVSNWKTLFLQIMELSIPHKLSNARKSLPWLNREITRAIKKRNCLFRLSKQSQAPADMRRYKDQRNHTLSLLRRNKKDYMAQLSSNDNKKF